MLSLLSDDKKALLKFFPLDEVLEYLELIFSIGERVAGTHNEVKAARFIKGKFEEIGLENVRLESFSVIRRDYKDCQLKMLEPFIKIVPCASAGTSLSTPTDGITSEVIDAGFGTLGDFEKLRRAGIETNGKIALIERSDRLTYWLDVPCHLAKEFGVVAVIFTSTLPDHLAFRKEAFPFPTLPTVYVPYVEAQNLRKLLRKEIVKVNLINVIDTDENGTSYNVTAEIIGSKYPKEVITITAHHDSWFGGANDNASGVAAILGIAKTLKERYKPKRTIKFISFGAEESGSKDFMEWCAGSFAYVRNNEEIRNVIANINLDSFAYGDLINVNTTPELKDFVEGLIEDLGFINVFNVVNLPTSWTDQWSFVMCGTPSINITSLGTLYEKIYHTNFDSPESVSCYLLEIGGKLALALALSFDSKDILPYNFLSTIKTLREHLKNASSLIDLSKMSEEVVKFEVLAHEFNLLRERGSIEKLSHRNIEFINKSQMEICRLLNKNMIGTGGEANKEATWVIEQHINILKILNRAIKFLKSSDLKVALKMLQSLPTMKWGLNVNLNVYNKVFGFMMNFSRYPALYPNIMVEVSSLKKQLQEGVYDYSEELSSLEKKYETFKDYVDSKISELEGAILECTQKLYKIFFQLLKRCKVEL